MGENIVKSRQVQILMIMITRAVIKAGSKVPLSFPFLTAGSTFSGMYHSNGQEQEKWLCWWTLRTPSLCVRRVSHSAVAVSKVRIHNNRKVWILNKGELNGGTKHIQRSQNDWCCKCYTKCLVNEQISTYTCWQIGFLIARTLTPH